MIAERRGKAGQRRFGVSLTAGSLVGLAAGIAVGIAAHTTSSPHLEVFAAIVEPLGGLWTRALLMTVLPLVVSQLITAVASVPGGFAMGRLGIGAALCFLGLLFLGAVFAVAVTPPLLAMHPISPETVALVQTTVPAATSVSHEPVARGLGGWLVNLVPSNPIAAAADGAILPLIIFSVLFGLAVVYLEQKRRRVLRNFFSGVAEAMLVLVGWVLLFTPIGVFALALSIARRAGLEVATALAFFVVLVSLILLVFTLALYPVSVLVGRVPLRDFAPALAPAQAVAISTRSSLASLPALLQGAEERLRLSTAVSGFALPLAVATFKISVVVANTVTCLFLARLYGIDLGPAQVANFATALILLSFAAPGIPSLGVTALPAFLAVGIPIEGVLVLHAVDVIPDIFKTLVNVTGDMTVATVLARFA